MHVPCMYHGYRELWKSHTSRHTLSGKVLTPEDEEVLAPEDEEALAPEDEEALAPEDEEVLAPEDEGAQGKHQEARL